jgi:putative peptidoglycan lipid II flippase
MGVVLLPAIARQEAAGDDAGRRRTVDRALVLGLALALPAAAALAYLADPIVSVLFERGRFSALDRLRTASALATFAAGLPFAVMAKVFAQVYFARQTPRLPVYAGLAALAVAIGAGLVGTSAHPATSAALAASLAFLVQGSVLLAFLIRDRLWQPRLALLKPLLGLLAATAAMLAALGALTPRLAHLLSEPTGLVLRMLVLAGICAFGLAVFAVAGRLLGAFHLRELGRLGKPVA